jgi:hypothetical protein
MISLIMSMIAIPFAFVVARRGALTAWPPAW